jgi:hypothetical protein
MSTSIYHENLVEMKRRRENEKTVKEEMAKVQK